MVITKLQATKRGNRINVYIDKQFAITVSIRLLSEEALFQGKRLSKNEAEKIRKKAILDLCYDRVVDLLSRRPRSEYEIRTYIVRKLKTKKDKNVLIDDLIESLKKKQLIDDKKFAKWWIRSRIAFKPRGSYLVTKELLVKGVDKDTIASALEDASFRKSEFKLALRAGEKKVRQMKEITDIKNIRRFIAYLQRKGFSYDIAKRALKNLQKKNT